MSDAIPRDVPFSLSCAECDVDPPDTYEEALGLGWTRITFCPDGFSENFVGICPICRWYAEHEETIRQGRTSDSDDQKGGEACPT